ncbi:histidinol-phosphatase HisJ family protein [Desulfofundulus thermosubterraneus]|uniref:Histidinol-phosphatase n=1 Tax=Desulfofundulus thermosubterraneus DSM 16057 TaxID=1121432 RepID=A0A1M6CBJ6_9FIRM|nr:histidinol-phosphatase HisJ family protein [Desulfofundulus thermosubterraneus]SHI58405.1 histidinol-phosphate phosphatase [Desulfofundulus thermosubterraneus DSM 16057]
MLPDLHLHTRRCGHATGDMEEYIAMARYRGLKHIGFADHVPMYWLPPGQRDPELAMSEEELPRYVESIRKLKQSCSALTIYLGIECDYIPGYENHLGVLLSRYPFDYVLGSVHYLDGWGFDNPDLVEEYIRRDVDELYRQYFQLVQQAACAGLFDAIAHPDLIKKFGYRARIDLQELYEETARAFAEGGVCVEVNTAGLRMPAGEIYPSLDFLKLCRRYHVPVTVGSDAHQPHLVAYGWDQARQWLQVAGYREVVVFKERVRETIPL